MSTLLMVFARPLVLLIGALTIGAGVAHDRKAGGAGRRGAVPFLLAWTALVGVAAALFPRALVPSDLFTMLFEGRTARVVEALAAKRGLPHAWLGLSSGPPVVPIVDHLIAEIACFAIALPWLAALISKASGRAWLGPAVVVGVCAADTTLLQNVLSDESQGFIALVATASAWLARLATRSPSGVARAASVGAMIVMSVQLIPLRPELALFAASAGVAGLAALLGPARSEALDARWAAALPFRRVPPVQTALLIALTVAGTYAVTVPGWLAIGEQSPAPPWGGGPDATTLRWLVDLGALHPPVVGAIATLGLAWCARRPLATVGVGVTFLLLCRVYAWNSHFGQAWFELLRYLANLQVLLVLLVAAGLAELKVWWDARPAFVPVPGWVAAAALGVVGIVWSALAPPTWPAFGPTASDHSWLVSRNHQLEGRFLLDAIRRHPTCMFRSVSALDLVADSDGQDQPTENRYTLEDLWFGWHVPVGADEFWDTGPAFLVEQGPEAVTLDWLESALAQAPCTLFYEGLDCHLQDGPSCDDRLAGLELVQGQTFEALEYNVHHGVRTPTFHLGIYRVR